MNNDRTWPKFLLIQGLRLTALAGTLFVVGVVGGSLLLFFGVKHKLAQNCGHMKALAEQESIDEHFSHWARALLLERPDLISRSETAEFLILTPGLDEDDKVLEETGFDMGKFDPDKNFGIDFKRLNFSHELALPAADRIWSVRFDQGRAGFSILVNLDAPADYKKYDFSALPEPIAKMEKISNGIYHYCSS